MTQLETLIQTFCPNGVKFVKLGEVAEIGTGKSNGNEAIEDGEFPFFVRSKDIKRLDKYEYEEEAIIIPGEGGIGDIFHYINGKYALHQRVYRIHFLIDEVNVKFAYYYMSTNFKSYIMTKAVSATVTSIRKPMIENFQIPLPPLAVQSEIVRVLDKFTLYKSELAAELAARLRQYEYYRDKLLTFDDTVEWKKLGEVFELRNGYTPSRNNHAFWDGGTIPWYRMEDIRKNGRILSDSIQHITPAAIKGKGLFKKDSFILATTATIGEHALLIADSLANQRFTNLQIRKSLKDSLLTKFVFYYMYVVDEFCKNHTNKSGFDSVDMKALVNMPFPLPPLSEQERIVSILDRFDKLCHDIREGLPAEIELRQKQYEHYRDKLLTFEAKG